MKAPQTALARSFIKRFGEEQANRVYGAAVSHRNGVHDNQGDDGFAWAVFICLGFNCFKRYREEHGFTMKTDDLYAWMRKNRHALLKHSGDVDYLALFSGTYDFLGEDDEEEAKRAWVEA